MPYDPNKFRNNPNVETTGQPKDKFYNGFLGDDDFQVISTWDTDTPGWWVDALDVVLIGKRMDVKWNEKLELWQCNISYPITTNNMSHKGILICYGKTPQSAIKTAVYNAHTLTVEQMFNKPEEKRRVL